MDSRNSPQLPPIQFLKIIITRLLFHTYFQTPNMVRAPVITLLTLSGLVTSAICGAIPGHIQKRDKVNANTQSCIVSDFIALNQYVVTIGVPFQDGQGCNLIQNTLNTAVGSTFSDFFCMDNGFDQTQINFSTQFQIGIGAKINGALEGIFPENLVNGGFNCPDF